LPPETKDKPANTRSFVGNPPRSAARTPDRLKVDAQISEKILTDGGALFKGETFGLSISKL
jgi:hypothetical protein